MRIQEVIRRPLLTEKSEQMREGGNTLTLEVHPNATKIDIARAVEAQLK